jgi:hypothetical protein
LHFTTQVIAAPLTLPQLCPYMKVNWLIKTVNLTFLQLQKFVGGTGHSPLSLQSQALSLYFESTTETPKKILQ